MAVYGNVNVKYAPCKSVAQLHSAADYILGKKKKSLNIQRLIMFLCQLRKVILSEFLVITDRESQHLQNSLLLY